MTEPHPKTHPLPSTDQVDKLYQERMVLKAQISNVCVQLTKAGLSFKHLEEANCSSNKAKLLRCQGMLFWFTICIFLHW